VTLRPFLAEFRSIEVRCFIIDPPLDGLHRYNWVNKAISASFKHEHGRHGHAVAAPTSGLRLTTLQSARTPPCFYWMPFIFICISLLFIFLPVSSPPFLASFWPVTMATTRQPSRLSHNKIYRVTAVDLLFSCLRPLPRCRCR
jgi:hypothetical protein